MTTTARLYLEGKGCCCQIKNTSRHGSQKDPYMHQDTTDDQNLYEMLFRNIFNLIFHGFMFIAVDNVHANGKKKTVLCQ